MATTIKVQAASSSGWVKVYIDGNKVLNGPGQATKSLDPGLHFLTYFVQGPPGTNYKVEIMDPPDDIWEVKGVLKSNHTTGQNGISIEN